MAAANSVIRHNVGRKGKELWTDRGEGDPVVLYEVPDDQMEAMAVLLERAPDLDGVFLCSDYMAVAAMEVIRAAGLRVPDDVAVAGYDDVPLAAWCNPRLTTIHQPVHRGGALMVDLLFAMLDGQPASPVTLPVNLVVRDSCGEAQSTKT